MLEYGFSLTRTFPYKDRIQDNTGPRKLIIWYVLCSVSFFLDPNSSSAALVTNHLTSYMLSQLGSIKRTQNSTIQFCIVNFNTTDIKPLKANVPLHIETTRLTTDWFPYGLIHQYLCKISQKTNSCCPPDTETYVCVSGSKNCQFFETFCIRTV